MYLAKGVPAAPSAPELTEKMVDPDVVSRISNTGPPISLLRAPRKRATETTVALHNEDVDGGGFRY